MHIGIQLHAPEGFETLQRDRIYHLLVNDARRERVLLVSFVQRPMRETVKAKRKKRSTPPPFAELCVLHRAHFEGALLEGRIVRVEPQAILPPWLGELSATELDEHNVRRRDPVLSHEDRIDRILIHIAPLIERIDEVLLDDEPFRVINRHARACTPPQHETRMRCWVLTYLCFGRNRWALHYPVHRIGHWDRMDHEGKKFGRPSEVRGAQHGFGSNDAEMIRKIDEGYRRFAGPGVHLSAIYRKTLTEVFGCRTTRNAFGRRDFYQPDGLPFPTSEQFEYRIGQLFPLEARQITKYGYARARHEMKAPEGHFYASVGSVMERVEADGYVVDEVCEGFSPGSHLPRLVVVRIRCQASGALVGIGFSVGGERASAYRMAKFCMAIDKVRFCALFGHAIEAEEWPCVGMSPHEIVDRGPGMTVGARAQDGETRPMISEGAPSYAGQSKAIVESSNPRAIKLEGQPTYVVTKLTIPQIAWREINRTICANNASDVGSRLNNDAITDDVAHTPVAVWNYLSARGRTYALPMAFDDAVRAFLTPIELKAGPYGVSYMEQPFDSEALRATGLHQRVSAGQKKVVLRGYMLDVCVCHVWVEVDGALIQVDAMCAIADGDEQLYVSVLELEQIAQLKRRGHREFEFHRQAEIAHWDSRFEAEIGVPPDQRSRRPGRAKRGSKVSVRERQEVMPYLRATKGSS